MVRISWADKEIKKNKSHKLLEQAMKDPMFRETQKKREDEYIGKAFDSFILISIDYMYRNLCMGKTDILKYIDFIVEQMHFAEEDDVYFKLLNEALSDEIGIDILNSSLKKASEKDNV